MLALALLWLSASDSLVAQGGGAPPARPGATPRDTARAPADTAKVPPSVIDTLLPGAPDTVKPVIRDTIKTPLARPYTPRSTEIGANDFHWDRDAMFASGALTLGELLAQVPGVSAMSLGFLPAPQVASWYSDPGRLRLFLDGVELDPINARNGGLHDLATVPLWALEDVRAERTAGDLRVHLRSWRVERTTPTTRTDILTGSENLSLYRGFFGRRFDNGFAVQLAGQQYNTLSRPGIDGPALGGMVRLGWARGSWSADGTFLRQGIDRSAGFRYDLTQTVSSVGVPNSLPPFTGGDALAYARIAWRDPQVDGPWAQFIASTQTSGEKKGTTAATATVAADTADTLSSRSQYTVAAGITRWGLRLSTAERLRIFGGKSYLSPSARVEYDRRWITVAAFAERAIDSTTRTDVSARYAPFRWFQLGASLSRQTFKDTARRDPITGARVEAGVQWRGRWLTGGVVRQSARTLAVPLEFDKTLPPVNSVAGTATVVGLRAPIAAGWHLDADVTSWNAAGPFRPQTESRARLWFDSGFLGRFPRNNFHLTVSGTQEYRSIAYFPKGDDPIGASTAAVSVYSTMIELRISQAIISWQYRNMLNQKYDQYPGYILPRLLNVYGVRWEFWN